jgi:hypothetical protein
MANFKDSIEKLMFLHVSCWLVLFQQTSACRTVLALTQLACAVSSNQLLATVHIYDSKSL